MKMRSRLMPVLLLSILMVFGIMTIPAQVYGMQLTIVDGPEIGTWAGFRKAAASFTFEDGAPSHVTDAKPMFDNYGYGASFYLVYNWNPDWNGFQSLANSGHEIGSHSDNHPQNMSGEEASSKQHIQGKIQQKYGCITVAYPNGNVPNETAVLQNYIAGRTYNGSWTGRPDTMGKDGPDNWAKVPALITGSEGSIKSTDDFTGQMQKVIGSEGWVVFATWGFQGKNNGNASYSPTDINAIDGALSWAKTNDKDIWIAPLRNVAMYIKERKASTIEQTGSNDSSMTFTLTHDIADAVSDYDYPLSVRVPMPTGWESVKTTQNGASLQSKIDGRWLYFDAVPNGGDILVQRIGNLEGAEVVLSATSFTYNGSVQKPVIKTIRGLSLTEGTDYTASWSDASSRNAGSYTVTITGVGYYAGTTSASYVINKATTKVTAPAGKSFTYNGQAKTGVAAGSNYTLSGTVNATKAGTYTAKATLKTNANYTYKWSDGTTAAKTIKWTINKAANPLTVKAKTATVKYSKLKKKNQTLAVGKVITFTKKGQGKMTYTKASGNKKITINKTTGKVTVKKGLKKGTYKVKVKVKAAGNANYKASAVKTVTFKIKVK